MKQFPSRQSGSAFWIILIGIFMFAALSYAVVQGGRSSSANLSGEKVRLAAQELIAAGQTMANGFQTLRLRGCTENQYDFANTVWKVVNGADVHPAGHNPSAVSGCSLFSMTDGKIIPTIFPRIYFSNIGPTGGQINYGSASIVSSTVPNLGNSNLAELFFHVPHLSRDVCLKINEALGIQNPGSEPPNVTKIGVYTAYSNHRDTDIMTDPSGAINGKTAFCLHDASVAGEYRFISVILVR